MSLRCGKKFMPSLERKGSKVFIWRDGAGVLTMKKPIMISTSVNIFLFSTKDGEGWRRRRQSVKIDFYPQTFWRLRATWRVESSWLKLSVERDWSSISSASSVNQKFADLKCESPFVVKLVYMHGHAPRSWLWVWCQRQGQQAAMCSYYSRLQNPAKMSSVTSRCYKVKSVSSFPPNFDETWLNSLLPSSPTRL